MSTQLIVYPQTYQGIHNVSYSNYYPELITNGQIFTAFNATTIQDVSTLGGSPSVHAIQQEYASAGFLTTGAWYRFKTSGVRGITTAPVVLSNNVVFPTTGSGPAPGSGVFQLLNNLTAGVAYTLRVFTNTSAGAPAAIMEARVHNNSGTSLTSVIGNNGLDIVLNFTATSSIQIISLNYYSTSLSTTVTSISVKPSAPIVTTTFSDGQVICDLYEEEDIPLTLSIDDFKNVAEQVKSYSKDFNLPATKRNNRIFDNMFEVTRSDNGIVFNPYVKTKCVLKQDGFLLFEGWLRMINIKDDEGEISYNVNLYSEVVAFADTLKGVTFAELDFTELTHDYDKNQIKNSWNDGVTVGQTTPITWTNANTSGFRTDFNTLKYPFVDWTGGIGIAAAGGGTVGNPELPTLEAAFRPCIQLKYLINKIFANTSFNWTSNFFDSADFEKLYMDFNWGSGNVPFTINDSGLGKPLVDKVATTSFATIESADNNFNTNIGYSLGVYTALQDNQTYIMDYSYLYTTAGSGAFNAEFRWKMVKGGVTSYINLASVSGTGASFGTSQGNFTQILNTGDTLTPEFKSATASTNTFTVLGVSSFIGTSATTVVTSASAVTNNIFLQTLRGELGQWDFLKGIMTMFNLVSMVDEDNPSNILIEPYADVFVNTTAGTNLASRSIQHDWTTKVDISQMELMPLTDLNSTTTFKFVEDDDDYVFNVYKQSTSGRLYGSKVMTAATSAQGLPTMLVGEKEIIAEPFAATVSRPIYSQFSTFVIPSIYAMIDDRTGEGFDNSPRIFYNNDRRSTGTTYYIPSQNGVPSENQPNFLQFSHLSTIPSISATTTDFVFQSEQLFPGVGNAPADNLYSTYWQPYFNELYNPDTRIMTLKVNLTPADIANFKFFDMVFIKNKTFRVNKIEYKPNELATVEFILIP
jgi:hypothetical protein